MCPTLITTYLDITLPTSFTSFYITCLCENQGSRDPITIYDNIRNFAEASYFRKLTGTRIICNVTNARGIFALFVGY